MTTAAWFTIIMIFVAIAHACGRGPRRPNEISWFEVYPHFTPGSKKARTRGDISHDGLTRRERAHR